MFSTPLLLSKLDLEGEILLQPVIVAANLPVAEAIALLQRLVTKATNNTDGNTEIELDHRTNGCTYLAVVEGNRLLGLLGEREVMRLVVSGRSLKEVDLAEVIDPIAVSLKRSELTVDAAWNLLRQHQIQYLPIVEDDGRLAGIVTYESLCCVWQSLELDHQIEVQINAQIESQVAAQTMPLRLQVEQSQLLMAVSTRLHASRSLTEILQTTANEVRQSLNCDRVSIYHFLEDWQFQVVAESIAADQRAFVSEKIHDPCFGTDWITQYRQGRVRVVTDIYTADLAPCHLELLERWQIRAKVLAPIVVDDQFWGLVSASESNTSRNWQSTEVAFLEQLAIQVAIAVESKQTATLLHQHQQELEVLLNHAPDVIFRLDQNLCYLYVNAAVESELGYRPESIIGRDLLVGTLAPEYLAEWRTVTQQVMMTGQEKSIEYQLHLSNRSIWFQTRVVPEYGEDGAVASFLCVARNITEQKQAAVKNNAYINLLLEWQNRYQAAQQASGQALYEWDLVADHVTWGSNTEQVFGYSPIQMPQTLADWLVYVHPDDVEQIQRGAEDYLSHQGYLCLQYRWQHRDGHYLWIEDQAQFFEDMEGNLTRVVGYVADISDRKQAEIELVQRAEALEIANCELNALAEQLKTQEEHLLMQADILVAQQQRYLDLFNFAPDAYFVTDTKGVIQEVNQAAAALLGQSPVQLHGKPLSLFVPASEKRTFRNRFYQLGQRPSTQQWEMYLGASNQSVSIPVAITVAPSRDPQGQITGYRWLGRDMTDRKRAEAALQASEQKLRQVTNSLPGLVFQYRLNADGTDSFPFISQGIVDLYGLTPEQVLNNPQYMWDMVHLEDVAGMQASIMASATTLTVWQHEYRIRSVDGTWKWLLGQSYPLPQEDGSILWSGFVSDISDRKQAAREIQKFATLADNSSDFIGICDMNLIPFYINEAGKQMVGLANLEEFSAIPVEDFFFPEDRDFILKQFFPQVMRDGQAEVEVRLRHFQTDEALWMLYNVIHIKDEQGHSIALATVSRNITERKQAELELVAQEERYRYIFEAVNTAILEEDFTEVKAAIDQLKAEGVQDFRQYFAEHPEFVQQAARKIRVRDVNQAALRLFKAQDKAELLADLNQIIVPVTQAAFVEELLALAEETAFFTTEAVLTNLQTDRFNAWVTISFPPTSDSYDQVLLSLVDTTEQKQAEAALRESEDRFRTMADNISQFAWMADENGWIFWYNQRWFDYTGTTLAEVEGWGWQKVHHPEHVNRVVAKIRGCFETGEIWEDMFPLRSQAGEYRWFLSRAIPIRDEQGNVWRWFGTNTDITELRETEIALKQTTDRLNMALRTAPINLSSQDLDLRYTWTYHPQHYPPEKIIGRRDEDLVTPETAVYLTQIKQQVINTGIGSRQEIATEIPETGQISYFDLAIDPIRDVENAIVGITCAAVDITDRKQTELALQESEEFNQRILDSSSDCIKVLSLAGEVLFINSGGLTSLEADYPSQVLNADWCALWQGEEREQARKAIAIAAAGTTARFQGSGLTLKGQMKWWDNVFTPSRDAAGEVSKIVVISRDITEQKQADAALRASEQTLSQVINTVPGAVYEFRRSPDGVERFTFMSRGVIDLYECTPEDLLQDINVEWNLILPADRDRVDATIKRSAETLEPWEMEFRIRTPSGALKWISGRSMPARQQDGSIAWFGFLADVTDRKRTELALQASEQRYINLAELSPVGIFHTEADGNCTYVNSRWCQLAGLTVEEAQGQGWVRALHPDDRDRISQAWYEAARSQTSFLMEYRFQHLDGSIHWLIGQAVAELDEADQVTGYIGTITDITDRKQAEQALQRSEARLRAIFEQVAVGIAEADLSGQLIRVNRGYCDLFGYSEAELLERSFQSITPVPEELELNLAYQRQLLAGEIDFFSIEKQMLCSDGELRWRNVTVSPIRNTEGAIERYLGVVQDIHQRKQAELALQQLNQELETRILQRTAALSESEARYRMLFEQAAVGISRCDLSGRYLQVNQRFCELTGYSEAELLELSWQDVTHPDDIQKTQPDRVQLTDGKLNSINVEKRYICKNGQLRWVSLTLSYLHDAEGNLTSDLAIVQDISDRIQLEAEREQIGLRLQNSERRLTEIISKTVDGILILDPEGQILFCNPAAARIFGCRNLDYQDGALHGETLGIPVTLQKTFELEIPHLTGEVIIAEVRVEEITWQDQKAFLAAVRDISDRKQAERELWESELSYRTLAENLPGSVYKLFPAENNKLVFFNDRLTTMLNLEPDQLPTDTICRIDSLIVRQDRDRVIQTIKTAIDQQEAFQVEYCIQNPQTGEWQYLLEQGKPVIDEIGQSLHVVGIIFDVTETKRASEQLRQINIQLSIANAELARATRLKDEFLANMSHELRTPLNSVLGLSEVLQEGTYGSLTPQQQRALTTIQTNGQHLLELINDILDLAKIESGKLEPQIAPVSVQRLCQSTVPFIQQQALAKAIKFRLDLAPHLGYIEVDERLMRQVLINLLSNAIKFTANGGSVVLRVEGNAVEQFLCFHVIDTGIGIAPEDIDRLFQPFVQIDSSLSRRYAGTGLGLALVRRIVELHYGTISIRSTVGEGSQFTVQLPWQQHHTLGSIRPISQVEERSAAPPETGSTNPIENPVLLLVDDNLDNVETLRAYLQLKGFTIIVATNGKEAVRLTQTQSFNLILMDIQMPDMDGLEAIRQIRASESVKTPILAITALAMPGDKEKCIAAGANGYLSKPVSPTQLVKIIHQHLQTT